MIIKKIGVDTDYTSYQELKRENMLAQGWGEYGDLSFLCDETEKIDDYLPRITYGQQAGINTFKNIFRQIKSGNVILAFEGNSLVGIAEIPKRYTYYYNDGLESYRNSLFPVLWIDWKSFCDDEDLSYQGGQGVRGIENCNLSEINEYINRNWEKYKLDNNLEIQPKHCDDKLNNLLEDLPLKIKSTKMKYMQKLNAEKYKDLIDIYVNLLKSNHNLILTGAPGTGKTYLAKEIAKAMDAEYEMVQFHPSYDYSDFVEGLRPIKEVGTKEIGFELVDGVFKAFCRRAVLSRLHGGDSFDKVYNSLIDDIKSGKISSYKTKTGIQQKLSINNNGQILYECKSPRTEKVDNLRLMFDYFVSNEIYDLSEYSKDTYCDIISQLTSGVTKTIDYVEYGWTLQEILNRFKDGGFNQPKMENKSKPFVFIIDEINRGEISKIFGELFYSIDPGYRVPFNTVPTKDEMIKTQYDNLVDKSSDNPFSEGFYVPDNVYIIGTMNDIDRSVESMDFAMRRRFAWKEIKAAENVGMLDELGDNKDKVIEVMNRLNNTIWNENDNTGIEGLSSSYHIGAAYFLKLGTYLQESDDDIDIAFRQLWFNHLKGLLYEYLRGYSNIAESMKILEKAYFGE